MRAATVISASELPYARVLAASLGEGELTALVLDAPDGALRADEPFEVVRPADLPGVEAWRLFGLPERELRRHLEPFLLSRFDEPVVLLAPDVLVAGPLDALLGGGPALVPRVLEPAGEDVLADGLYDSGVLGWGPDGARVLAWWRERAQERLGAEAGGAHILDAAPGLFEEVAIVRDRDYGVAPWNLGEAGRSAEGARTIRFADFDPARPGAAEGLPGALGEDYARRLREAGWEERAEPDAPLARLANGVEIDAPLRDVIGAAAEHGVPLGDLETREGTHALLEWANGPASDGAVQGVTRYLHALHGRRLDLHDGFRTLEDDDGEAFVHWARTTGRREGIPDVLLPLLAPEARPADDEPPPLGVNVAGYLRTGIGVGEAARLYVTALEAAQVPVRTETADPGLPKPKRTGFEDRRPAVEYPFNLVCVNAFELPDFARRIGAGFFEDRVTIGQWAWEASAVPPTWDDAFALVDEIWTYSDYVTSVLAAASPVPVVTLPPPVLAPKVAERAPDLGLPDGFTFLFTFDFFSTTRRKNPIGLVEAYTRAFTPEDGTQLVLKTFNGDAKPESLRELLHAAEGRPDVHVVDRFLEVEQKNALVARADCYVSLHRSEGFGLSLAEAMLLGKPVVATGYSGNLEFMTPANSWLVGYELTRVGEGSEIYPADAEWADPDLDHAAALMREVRAGGDAVRARAERGRRDVEQALSPERTGAAVRARLERLAALAPTDHPAPGSARAGLALQAAREKAAYDPESTGGGAGDLPRKATLRAMRPYTHHQRELNDRLVAALEEQARRIDELQEEVRRGKHGIAAARRQSLAAEWRAEELERRLRGEDDA
jgi:glycosyltransferase involved in cell wall biosynthesis